MSFSDLLSPSWISSPISLLPSRTQHLSIFDQNVLDRRQCGANLCRTCFWKEEAIPLSRFVYHELDLNKWWLVYQCCLQSTQPTMKIVFHCQRTPSRTLWLILSWTRVRKCNNGDGHLLPLIHFQSMVICFPIFRFWALAQLINLRLLIAFGASCLARIAKCAPHYDRIGLNSWKLPICSTSPFHCSIEARLRFWRTSEWRSWNVSLVPMGAKTIL